MEPLAVDLRIGLCFADEPILDESTMPAHGTWHVRREDLSDARGVRPAVEGPGHQERRVAVIDTPSIERVIAEAIAQPALADRLVTLFSLEAANARARLLDPELTAAASIPVWSGRHEHAVAVVRDERGSWIDGIADALERPLRLQISNNDGAVGVNLYIAWSLWKQEGSAEHAAVLDFARSVLAGGYEVEHVDPAFRAGLGA